MTSLVIGGGNAGLCAALTARQAGASVIVLDSAPRHFRGGNSRHTRNFRCAHAAPTDVLTESYPRTSFSPISTASPTTRPTRRSRGCWSRRSAGCPEWMRQFGVRFQSSLRGTLHLGRTNVFFLGGGKALMNSYYAAAERAGIRVEYDAEVVGLDVRRRPVHAAPSCGRTAGPNEVSGRALVVAAGGFESNIEWLREVWGSAADNFIIRGTPYNTGTILRLMLDAGAEPIGDPRQCHAIAVDARAPRFDGGIVTRLDSLPFGIVVNRHAERFYDEGEDAWPKRYAIWGRLIAAQPDQIAYSIVDAKAHRRVHAVGVSAEGRPARFASLRRCSTCRPNGSRRRSRHSTRPFGRARSITRSLDDCRTEGLTPPKSHWAQRIDTPPFWGYPLRPGITFTYLGVQSGRDPRAW